MSSSSDLDDRSDANDEHEDDIEKLLELKRAELARLESMESSEINEEHRGNTASSTQLATSVEESTEGNYTSQLEASSDHLASEPSASTQNKDEQIDDGIYNLLEMIDPKTEVPSKR